jgi:HEAT repeat protein
MRRATLLQQKKSGADLEHLPVVRQMLQALTHDDGHIRTAARNAAVGTLRGKSRSVIIDGLVKLLRRKDADVRQRAAGALVAFRTAAIPALLLGLWRSRDAAWQVRLAQVLTAIVPRVPAPERMRLFFEVDRALWRARDEAVMRACIEAQAALMRDGDHLQPSRAASAPRRNGHSPVPAYCVKQQAGRTGA